MLFNMVDGVLSSMGLVRDTQGTWSWEALGAALLLLLVPVQLSMSYLTRNKYDFHKIPKSPGGTPILGILPLYWTSRNFTAWFLKFHDSTKTPILRASVLHKQAVLVADPGVAAQILARTGPNNVPRKVPEYSVFDDATGLHGHHSILTEQDEEMWLAVRKALSPAYTPAANRQNYAAVLKAYGDVGRRIAAAIRHQSETATQGCAARGQQRGSIKQAVAEAPAGATARCAAADVMIDHHLLGAAIQTQVEGLFGMQPGIVNYLKVANDLELAIGTVHDYCFQPWKMIIYRYLPWVTEHGRKLCEARLRLARECYQPIMKHVETCNTPSELSLTACLHRIIEPRTGRAPCRERLLAEVGNQIMAPETAAHTIAWVLYCVATHPDTEAKLLQELSAAGLPCNGDLDAAVSVLAVSFDPLKNLPYLEAVVNEAMRLYPAGASASPRLTEKDTNIGPYRVPAGVMIFPCLYVINRYSGTWGDDASQFKPERWQVPDAAIDAASGAPKFLPFSAGPKNCIGLALGQVAVRSAVAMLLSTFSFRPAVRMGNHDAVLARSMLALTLKVEGGMWLNATYRSDIIGRL